MHHKRLTVHGDVDYVTPKEVSAERSRQVKISTMIAAPWTYKKLHGRHEHRVVAETILGRPLNKGEVVHHKDRNRHNNSPGNLMIFKSQSEHAKYHQENDLPTGAKQ